MLLAAFFALAETSMMAINRYRLRHLSRTGHRTARRIQKLLERPDRLLGVILIGSTFANIFASSIATLIAVRLFGDVGIIFAAILLTFLMLIFSEIAPKTLAALYPQRVAFLVSLPLTLFLWIIYPIVWVANSLANAFLFLFGVRVKGHHFSERLNREELRTVVHESMDHEDQVARTSRQPKEMLLGVLDLDRVKVEDIMIPRNEIVGIDLQDPWEETLKVILNGHSRFVVYHGNVDKIAGVFYLRDAIRLLNKNQLNYKNLIKALREPYFVPEGTSLHTQLHEFRLNNRRQALVVDEYGDILGFVTLESILEEIVGELDKDSSLSQRLIIPEEEGIYIIDASISIRELNKSLSWDLPINGPKTISGLIIESLETIPQGPVSLQVKNYLIEVLAVKKNKVVQVKMEKIPVEDE